MEENKNKNKNNKLSLTQPKWRVLGITNLNKVWNLCPKAYFPLTQALRDLSQILEMLSGIIKPLGVF